jgi:hypothetical protein
LGAVQWTANGVAICTFMGNQIGPVIASDAGGGAIVTWGDARGSNYDVYAQRVGSAGTVQWTTNGVPVCAAPDFQGPPRIIADGAGGAIVSWADNRSGNSDVYGQRIDALGAMQWTGNGVAICSDTTSQGEPALASDGNGGAIVAWQDPRNGDYDIYAQRIAAAGSFPTGVRDASRGRNPALATNRPNPFSGATTIELDLPVDTEVTVDVFDVSGRRVRRLEPGRLSAGTMSLRFDSMDERGRPLPSGVYFCRVRTAGDMVTRKMVISR